MANIISIGGGSGRPKYTATVSSNVTSHTYTYIKVNDVGQDYNADGSTFTWTDGDNIVFRLGPNEWDSYVYVNGERVWHRYGGYYTYTPPSKDISINMTMTGSDKITVEITYPYSTDIMVNGTYDILDYTIVNVSVGENNKPNIDDPVRFFDYDGTLLYSYSVSDFYALTSMPANPSHSGLTAQGWNWSLTDAKAQVTAMGTCDIGQMYVTSDGKTRLYCHFEDGRLSPFLGICPNGTVTIDWGDNTATSTLTGTSTSNVQRIQHVYATGGDYVITLTPTSGSFSFYGTSNGSYVLQKTETNEQYISNIYTNAIRKVELGTNALIGNYSFYNCFSLETITIPSSVTLIGNRVFYYCYSLQWVTIPAGITTIYGYTFTYCSSLSGISLPYSVTNISNNNLFASCSSLQRISIPSRVTALGSSAFQYCYALRQIKIPSGVTSIGSSAFSSCTSLVSIEIPSGVTSISSSAMYACRSLAKIIIPSNITSIAASAFSDCRCLGEIHFKSTAPPAVANANAFGSIPTDCKIYVPTGRLSTYTSAENYPSSATYTYIEE